MTDQLVLQERAGSICVTAHALTRIVVRAAESVAGARVRRPRRGLDLELADGRASVAVVVSARYGVVLPELGREVQERIAEALREMCEVDVARVDVAVEELER